MSTQLTWPVLGLVLLAVASRPVAAQEPVPPQPPLSASLMRRLAAAADAYRTGDSVFIVAKYELPHDVVGVFFGRGAADSVKVRAGAGVGVFGPYVTPPDLDLPLVFVGITHCRPSILPCEPMPEVWVARDIDSVAVVAYHRAGRTLRSVSRGVDGVDAIFFSLHAFDIFAVPYYTALSGPHRAAALRDSISAVVRERLER